MSAPGPDAFVHLDVMSAFSRLSPSTPHDYAAALAAQFPLDAPGASETRPALAICDVTLASAVKAAVACARAGVDHLPGIRLRVVPEASWRPWAERPRELLLLAGDEEAWLSIVALANTAHLANADHRGPRVDWRDLEQHARGQLICLSGAPLEGVLGPLVEHAADPGRPLAAIAVARRLAELYPQVYIELAYHGHAREKLINHGLVALAERLDLPLVATNAVRFARPQDGLAHRVLEAMHHGRRADGVLRSADTDGADLPVVSVAGALQPAAYLKTPAEMQRLFGRLPAALQASVEIRQRVAFRLPLAADTPPEQRYGPALLFGLGPLREADQQRLAELVEQRLPQRLAETGRGQPSVTLREQAQAEVRAIGQAGLAELLLVAYDLGQFCAQYGIALAARGSAANSLLVWILGLSELFPPEHGLDLRLFVHDGRQDLPDLDLEVAADHAPTVSAFLARYGTERISHGERGAMTLPAVGTLRLGINVSLGARQAVRSVGAALGLEPIRVHGLARQVPLLSSPGAIEQVLTRAPELGGGLSASSEPGATILRLAGQIEGLPQRAGAHPSAYVVSFSGPGALSWLPAHWVNAERPGRDHVGRPRHSAVGDPSTDSGGELAHPSARPPNAQRPAASALSEDEPPDRLALGEVVAGGSGPVLACAWDKSDLEALGLPRLDLTASAALASVGRDALAAEPAADLVRGAWRLVEAGDTRCLSQVESPGFQALLRRVREAARDVGITAALASLEDLAQLLALWRPGAGGGEAAYLEARFGGQRPRYAHPALASVLDATSGALLYADQVVAAVRLLGFDHAWADQFRRALASGQRARRIDLERALRAAGRQLGWSDDQLNALLALLQEHAGYLHAHGHALVLARHVLAQACAKLDPATTAAFFAALLNSGGSAHYGLGAAVEEARRWGVLLLPPCVNRSTDRYAVEPQAVEPPGATGTSRQPVGAIRVPLGAIRGLSAEAAQHVLAVRAAFGPFTSLLDFCRRVERGVVDRRSLLVLIKLGAFAFTGLPRAQLAFAEQFYASAGELLRAADRNPLAVGPFEDELAQLVGRYVDVAEWPAEVLAADELAHLGFYLAEVDAHTSSLRVAEEFSTLAIAELVDHPHHAPVSIAGIVTTLRVRQTRKGEEMAWLSIADASGAVECAVFPDAYRRLGQPAQLREGAFLVARGRLAHEEATGTKVWIDSIVPLGGNGAHLSALQAAVEHQRTGLWAAG